MKPITKTIIDEYKEKMAKIEPVEFVSYMKDSLVKKNSKLLGLMEYLRLRFPLSIESLSVMCTIIRYAMVKQKSNNELRYMVFQERTEELIISDDIIHYIYCQINKNYEEFISKRMKEVSDNGDDEFMSFVMKISELEMDYISRMTTEFVPSFETRIIAYIPMLCVYDLYTDFIEKGNLYLKLMNYENKHNTF